MGSGGASAARGVSSGPAANSGLHSDKMSDLDDELRAALEDSEQRALENSRESTSGADVPGGDAPGVSVAHQPERTVEEGATPSRNVGLLAALLVAAGGILTLVFTSVDDAAIYSVSTDKLLAQSSQYEGKTVRVVGTLVEGTLKRRDEPCEYRFTIQDKDQKLPVRYPNCVIPDTLKDAPDVQVTAEGSLSEEGHFQATHVMAKCPSKYEMQERANNGEAVPHSMDFGAGAESPSARWDDASKSAEGANPAYAANPAYGANSIDGANPADRASPAQATKRVDAGRPTEQAAGAE